MIKDITIEDVPEKYMSMVEAIGLEGFLGLVMCYGGSVVYVPTLGSVRKGYRNRIIREMYCGDYDEVARRFGISRSQVYNIVNEG